MLSKSDTTTTTPATPVQIHVADKPSTTKFFDNARDEISRPLDELLPVLNDMMSAHSQTILQSAAPSDRHLQETERIYSIQYKCILIKDVISNLLNVNQIASNKMDYKKTEFLVSGLFNVISDNIYKRARIKELDYTMFIDESLMDMTAIGDPQHLENTITVLANASIKFVDDGTVVLRVQAEKGMLVIKIEGRGQAYRPPNTDIPRLMMPDGSMNEDIGSHLGLTLAVCEHIICQLQGTMTVNWVGDMPYNSIQVRE